MTGDDLNTPLGRNRVPRRPVPYRVICLASAGLLVLGGIIYLSFRGDPFGGEPHAVATITQVAPAPAAPPPAAQAAPVDTQPTGTIVPASDANSAAAIERRSGVKIVRNGNAAPPGAEIIDVPQVLADRLAPAPDPRLVEHGRYGLLPRIGKNGARAADVYARPYAKSAKPNAPKIALVVGGVGLNDAATAQAIESLPGPVTLAFAPYGNDLKGKVAQAREAGHEVILQIPMEPIDYPQTDPGPHTLLSTATAADNDDHLHWLMARFTGYTGVANFLGAKFTRSATALQPILREIGERGLFYLDDGSSAQSLGPSLAKDAGLPAISADLILDTVGEGDSMEARLAKLETIARQKGVAVGMANDLPTSVEKLAQFIQMAQAHGIVLIPLSAAVAPSPATSARAVPAFQDP